MSIFLARNPVSKIMAKHYGNLKEIIYTHGVILTLGQKRLYSTRIDYNLNLPRMPFETIFSAFFEKKAFFQALILGPLQILIEGLALGVSISEYLNTKANFSESSLREVQQEFKVREDSLSKVRDEEQALTLFANILISDINQSDLQPEIKTSTAKHINNYLLMHLDAKNKIFKDAI